MEPVLRTCTVARGRICAVCFDSISTKKKKKRDFHEITDNLAFTNTAESWTEYEHDYASVLHKHDHTSTQKLYYHHKCQSFFDERYRLRQTKKNASGDVQMEIDSLEAAGTTSLVSPQQPGPSTRHTRSSGALYETTKDNVMCIICTIVKRDSHGKPIPAKTMQMRMRGEDLHQAEMQLIEFAEIHRTRNSKYKDAADRVILQRTTKSLFAADVGFHTSCYDNFRSPSWKKTAQVGKQSQKDEYMDELMNLVEYLVIEKKEIYTLAQFRNYYEHNGGTIRSIDIKDKIVERFSEKVNFCKPTEGDDKVTEYVLPSDSSILPKTIRAVQTGEGITSCLQLKSIAQNISDELKTFPKCSWPPTPQDIIQSTETVSTILYNFLAWIVCPHACVGKDGLVKFSENKATIVTQICDNITALSPHNKPTLSQVLLSLSIYAKTGSKLIIDDLKRIGTGISYTETIFILDKGAEWIVMQGSIIPGNIVKDVMCTHVFDNIDWSNKNGRLEVHLTNSILIQRNNIVDQLAHVSLNPDYDFARKDHRSFKGTSVDLPQVTHKKSEVHLFAPDDSHRSSSNLECSSSRTLTWILARYRCLEKYNTQSIPGWSGFQQLSSEPDTCPVTVGYLPPIAESPTQMRVIYAEIERTLAIMHELNLPFVFIEADQAIYTKVLDAMFKLQSDGKEVFKKVIPRMGGFHVLMCMLKTIFSLFKNIGFVQLLNSAGLGGMGTIKKFLKGGDVKEGIELNKKLFEALMRTKIDNLLANESDRLLLDTEIEQVLDKLVENVTPLTADSATEKMSSLLEKMDGAKGEMGKLIDVYLEMVNLMLNFIHFTRRGNWEGFMEAIFQFLPYCFRLNRNRYARDLSFYYNHMCSLETENPTAYAYLKDGGFSGSLTGLPHSRIPFDQIIEMTINRSCKDIGGLPQTTNNIGAAERWTRTNHLMVALREHLNKKVRRKSKFVSRELGKPKIKRDESAVKNIQSCLERWIPDIWSPTKTITHIFSGIKASEEMTKDSLDIKDRGMKSRDLFLKDLSSKEKKNVYYGPIKRQDIKLFTIKEKKKTETITSDECQSFSEVFALFDERKLNLRSILEWPVFSKPWAIVNEDLKSRNNAKSSFRNSLQSMAPVGATNDVPTGISASIVDGMRVVRLIRPASANGKTLRHWTKAFVKYVATLPGRILHLVFDNYNYQHSVPSKNRDSVDIEREINSLDQEHPATSEWDTFLMNNANKRKLINLLVDYILSIECKFEKTLYINREDLCYIKEVLGTPRECEVLHSTHREADQKIPIHAVFAGTSADESICVVADDSDIYLSLLYTSHLVESNIYFRQGKTKDKHGIEYHDVHSLASHLGRDVCDILLGFHSLTNPFFGRTKVTAFKKLLQKKVYCYKLWSLGSESVDISKVTDFILHIIYNRPMKEKTPGESRHRMLLTSKTTKDKKKKYPSSRAIVPDEKSLKMKSLRASFITHVMINCCNNSYVPLNPADYGWKWSSTTSNWDPVWYEGNALPDYADINDPESGDGGDCEDENVEDVPDVGGGGSSDENDEDDDDSDCISSDESSEISDME